MEEDFEMFVSVVLRVIFLNGITKQRRYRTLAYSYVHSLLHGYLNALPCLSLPDQRMDTLSMPTPTLNEPPSHHESNIKDLVSI